MHSLFACLFLLIFTGDGICCICNSFVNPETIVHVCDECQYGSNENRCVICSNPGAYPRGAVIAVVAPSLSIFFAPSPNYIFYSKRRRHGSILLSRVCTTAKRSRWMSQNCKLGVRFVNFAVAVGSANNTSTHGYELALGCLSLLFLLHSSTKTDLFYERKKYGFKKR